MNSNDRYNLQHPRPTLARGSTAPAGLVISRPKIKYPSTPYPIPPPRPSAPPPSSPQAHRRNHASSPRYERRGSDTSNSPSSESFSGVSASIAPRQNYKAAGHVSLPNNPQMQYPALNGPIPPRKDDPALRSRTALSYQKPKLQQLIVPQPANISQYTPIAIPTVSALRRPEPDNNVHFTPDNLFVSLACSHTLKIYNLTPSNNGPNAVMEAVRKDVVSLWKQGFKYDKEGRGEWSIRFNGNIWRMRGDDGVVVRRMICQLFTLLAAQGYSYLCSVQNTRLIRSPRHLFTTSPPANSRFFMLSFSLNRRKLAFIDIPPDLQVSIANALRHACPFAVDELDDEESDEEASDSDDSDDEGEDSALGVYTVRLRRRMVLPRNKRDVKLFLTRNKKADMLLLLSTLLKVIASHGYRLDASLPLGRARPMGLRGRREVWIFKSVSWKISPTTS